MNDSFPSIAFFPHYYLLTIEESVRVGGQEVWNLKEEFPENQRICVWSDDSLPSIGHLIFYWYETFLSKTLAVSESIKHAPWQA